MLPAISAAPVGSCRERHREVERADDGEDAVRPEDGAGVDGRVTEVAHRVVVAVVVLHRLGVVAEQVGRFLDLAERLDPVLPDLDRHVGRVRHQVVADVLGRPADDREPFAPRDGGPGRLSGTGGSDCGIDVRGRAGRERAHEDVAIDRRPRLEAVRPVAPLAVDVVLVVPAELGLRVGDCRLETGVQLLVVGGERCVRDLDARCGIGRHLGVASGWRGDGTLAVSLARRQVRPARKRPHRGDRYAACHRTARAP